MGGVSGGFRVVRALSGVREAYDCERLATAADASGRLLISGSQVRVLSRELTSVTPHATPPGWRSSFQGVTGGAAPAAQARSPSARVLSRELTSGTPHATPAGWRFRFAPPSRSERRGRRGSPGQEVLRASRAPPSRARRRPRPLAIPIQATGRRCPLRTTRPRAASGAVAAGRLGERYCARARRVLRGLEDGRVPPRSHARLPAVDARSGRPGLALCGVGSIG
jgi:hypothetical protein